MSRWSILMLGTLVVALTLVFVAAPLQAGTRYGGIGAVLSHFDRQNPHGPGTPLPGGRFYRPDALPRGRVAAYHLVLNPQSSPLSIAELKRLVTGSELPKDAKLIKDWKPNPAEVNGYCAIYSSRWLGRVFHARYVWVDVSAVYQTAGANLMGVPFCRG